MPAHRSVADEPKWHARKFHIGRLRGSGARKGICRGVAKTKSGGGQQTSSLRPALPWTMPILIIVTRRSWWHWHQTSSLPLPARAGPCADVAGAFCCRLHGKCHETCRPKEEPSLQAKENPARARGLVVADQRDGLRGHVPIAASSSFISATVRSIMRRAKSSIGSPAMR